VRSACLDVRRLSQSGFERSDLAESDVTVMSTTLGGWPPHSRESRELAFPPRRLPHLSDFLLPNLERA
jgi:hypothetical protein